MRRTPIRLMKYLGQRKTATEIRMGQERDYSELLRDDVLAAQSSSGHLHVRSYYNSIRQLPRNSAGMLPDTRHHMTMLEDLDAVHGNMYYSEKEEMFVGDWSIETPEIYHRHKELGMYQTMDGMDFSGYHDLDLVEMTDHYKTYIMWDAAKGLCRLCGEQMPGEIMMMHKFYQF